MDFLNIFLLGGVTGIIFSLVSMVFISAHYSEIYPVGGFIPALWMVHDLGISSQIVVAGILIMGGMTGFYLTLTFWKERSFLSNNDENKKHYPNHSKEINPDSQNIQTIKGKSLADFL
tara:strand:- start:3141 stop:3494 length:354 start_codon:yes stop_codon:yes gene_type:complete